MTSYYFIYSKKSRNESPTPYFLKFYVIFRIGTLLVVCYFFKACWLEMLKINKIYKTCSVNDVNFVQLNKNIIKLHYSSLNNYKRKSNPIFLYFYVIFKIWDILKDFWSISLFYNFIGICNKKYNRYFGYMLYIE